MSGVRVVSPELYQLGSALPELIEKGRVIASLAELGEVEAGAEDARHCTAPREE